MAKRAPATPVVETPVVDVPVVDTPVDTPVNTDSPEVTPEPENPVVDDVIPAAACELWGTCDQNSKACKSCEVFEECKVKTQAGKRTARAQKDPAAPRVVREKTGVVSKFSQSDLGKQNGIIDTALEIPRTLAELEAATGCSASRIRSHIKWLEVNRAETCTKVLEGGKIHFTLIAA